MLFTWFSERARGLLIVGGIAVAVSGCASAPPAEDVDDILLAQRYADAVTLQEAGQLDRAEQRFVAIAEDYPLRIEPRISLALLQSADGRYEEAEDTLEAVVAASPDSAVAWNELGILRRRAGRFAEADEAYVRALDADQNYALAHRNRGILMDLYTGQPAEALRHYRRYVEIAGADDEVDAWIAELELRVPADDNELVAEGR
jgi:tetratricopeptide (TPR) repeat protein